jgi:hypothetical protein
METPDWLKADNGDSRKTNNGGASSDYDNGEFTTVATGAPSPPDIESTGGGGKKMKRASSSSSREPDRTCSCSSPSRCLLLFRHGTSVFFVALFAISASFQGNDASASLLWMLFYALHAVAAALFLVFACCVGLPCLDRPMVGLGAAMAVWSVVLVTVSAIRLAGAAAGGPRAGGDASAFTDREEKALEVAGAALGLVSALYHTIVWKYCAGKSAAARGGDSDNSTDEYE